MILKVHTKTDDQWRNHMLDIIKHGALDLFEKNNLSSLGCYKEPYNYVNHKFDVENLEALRNTTLY